MVRSPDYSKDEKRSTKKRRDNGWAAQQLILGRKAGGAKGAVRWSAHAMRRRSGVAGESSSNQPLCPASSLAEYTASYTMQP